ncbi:tetratricopeptide repeat protein [Curvivirga aplysinae]|uniref:tetratricopeptide repeat-containing glycosyltransferase family protein n=1 Tax=Curvivirga aplysinae TaxID=2529852 RepID=UPI0012BB8273|nr:tetratricopeptide repeat protein [Curvivirga aplysinae]MTI09565.1 tetratricopeptide repeat protein [Curvivirga aplysinae]
MGSDKRSEDFQKLEQLINMNQLADAEAIVKSLLSENASDALALNYYAIIAFKAGQLPEAIQFAEQAVSSQPDNVRVLNTIGYLKRVDGQFEQAITYLKRAISLDDKNVEALNNLGIVHFENGSFDEAITSYHHGLSIDNKRADIFNNLGNALVRGESFDAAIEAFDAAIKLAPEYAQAWSNKGETILRHKGLDEEDRQQQYRECIEKAAGLAPDWLNLQYKYANLLSGEKENEKAEEVLRKSLSSINLSIQHVPMMVQLARLLDGKVELDEALLWARQALVFEPDNIGALQVMAHISLRIGHPVEAIELYKKAITLKPDLADLHYGLGNSYMRLERIQDALDCYLKVHNMDKNNPRGIFAPAACLLLNGEYEKGWAAYESRYRVDGFKPNVPNVMDRLWDGSPLNNRHLVVHVEQGFGDTFQFCRYLEVLREREGDNCRITLLCEPETIRLLKNITGPDEVLSLGERHQIRYDVQIPLLSLPHRMGTSLQTVPAKIPYVITPEECKNALNNIEGTELKVGIVWAGRPTHSDDRYRSIDINIFSKLFDVKEVAFYALQWGERAEDLKPWLDTHANVVDEREGLRDFADTAGLIEQLDLVIAVDTSVAHLAGALGKPVWTLIPYGAEWRWLLEHERTPWYPTMRLYRQKVLGHWGPVLDRLKQHLYDVLEEKKASN